MKNRQRGIFLTGILFGLLAVSQYLSFQRVTDIVARDRSANIFSEVQILKSTSDSLRAEVEELKTRFEASSNSWSLQEAVQKEMLQKQLFSGDIPVKGPGIRVSIPSSLEGIWLVDTVNELFTAGAEAISVNSLRLTDTTIGFDSSLSGQILLHGTPLSPPFIIRAIGDKKMLEQALRQAGGIIARIKSAYPDVLIDIALEDVIEMPAVL